MDTGCQSVYALSMDGRELYMGCHSGTIHVSNIETMARVRYYLVLFLNQCFEGI